MADIIVRRPEFKLTILSGQQVTDQIDLHGGGSVQPLIFRVYAPTTLPETVNLESAQRITETFLPHQSDGTPITVPESANITVSPFQAGAFRLASSAPVAADREFTISLADWKSR